VSVNSKDPKNRVPDRLKQWFHSAKSRGADIFRKSRVSKLGDRIPSRWKDLDLDLRKYQVGDISNFTRYFHWGLVVLGVFFLAEFTARMLGLWLKPGYVPPPPPPVVSTRRYVPQGEYDAILNRNMFNVEGTIPEPFDQGQLDCFSQARPSTQRIMLLGTIVMSDDKYSVALVQEEGAASKEAVRQGDGFSDSKLQAMKIDRKRLCFQVRSSQDLEFIEIPDADGMEGANPVLSSGSPSDGINPVAEDKFMVNQNFLEKNILNLNEILQTARAVPYLEPGTGQFKGFLIQSMDPESPFSKLGVRQGDILTAVNDIVLDNAGKGLEAFQRLRNSPKIDLEVIRAGQRKALTYDIRP
jgi:general secretion pathway protein C